MLYAVFHIVGSLALTGGLIYTTLILNRIWGERADRQIHEQISIALGIPASTLRKGELTPAFIGQLSSRYSNDLLRNRLSDLWDTTLLVWDLLAHLMLIAVVGPANGDQSEACRLVAGCESRIAVRTLRA